MSLCPCGSGLELDACCGPYVEGAAQAPTAEALMRARYTAHCLGKYEFLNESTHPEFREETSADDIKEWSSLMNWESLDILETTAGGADDAAFFQQGLQRVQQVQVGSHGIGGRGAGVDLVQPDYASPAAVVARGGVRTAWGMGVQKGRTRFPMYGLNWRLSPY